MPFASMNSDRITTASRPRLEGHERDDDREANELMSEHQVRRLPVIENNQLVGIVSLGDLAVKEGKDRRTGDTLQEISAGVKE